MGRKRVFSLKQTKEKPELKEAAEVQELAARLIDKYHSHLAEARIKYLFRTGEWLKKGRIVYGKAEKVPAKWNYLTGYDFVITINQEAWMTGTPEFREALLDHELEHCCKDEDKQGNPKWYIQPHTVEDFASIIRRHGLWDDCLKLVNRAREEFEQISMLKPSGTDG